MTTASRAGVRPGTPPGVVRPARFRPRFHYELIVCGLRGHALVGTDTRVVTPDDAALVRDEPGRRGDAATRWHRCLRCDAWVPLPPPEAPTRERVPGRAELALPLRGRPLRDRVVLRLIALDRVLHFLVLGVLAAAVFVFLADRAAWQGPFFRLLGAVEDALGPSGTRSHELLGDARAAFTVSSGTLLVVGLALAAYALLEGVEAVGLWWGRRWAEYLTFVATAALLVPEIYELTSRVTVLKVVGLVINVAVVVYLVYGKRLFGIRGGGRAERAEHERDSGWAALERATPAASDEER